MGIIYLIFPTLRQSSLPKHTRHTFALYSMGFFSPSKVGILLIGVHKSLWCLHPHRSMNFHHSMPLTSGTEHDDLAVADGREEAKQKTANVLATSSKFQLSNAVVLFTQSRNAPVGFLSSIHSHAGQVNWKLYSAQSRCEYFFSSVCWSELSGPFLCMAGHTGTHFSNHYRGDLNRNWHSGWMAGCTQYCETWLH